MNIRPMTIEDYEQVLLLMRGEPGVSVRTADSPEAITRYLDRNPGFSFVAESDEYVVGCVFGGHDGRRGSLHHLVVAPAFRMAGVGRLLVTQSLDALQAAGIEKTLIDVFSENDNAIAFWGKLGWEERDDLRRFSFNRSKDPNV